MKPFKPPAILPQLLAILSTSPFSLFTTLCICIATCNVVAQQTTPLTPAEATDAPPNSATISKLIDDLDSNRYATRERAERKLLAIGEAAIPSLLNVAKHASLEKRLRAERIVTTVQHTTLLREFKKLASLEDSKIDLDRGMWLINRSVEPDVKLDDINKRLDGIAESIRRRLMAISPNKAKRDPKKVVQVFCEVLNDEYKFAGNLADYSNPRNSCIQSVLKTKKGLPILLSHVMVAAAERLDEPIVGLPVPGRYMVKYVGKRAPDGFAKVDIIVDPFGRWTQVTATDLKRQIPGFEPTLHLKPSLKRDTLIRMMNNLMQHLARAGKIRHAERVATYARIVDSR